MKVVINDCYGGFGEITPKASLWLRLRGWKASWWVESADDEANPGAELWLDGGWWSVDRDISRSNPLLVEMVETLGKKADGPHARMKVVEIPDDVEWQVEEYDGLEWIAEKHRTWR